MPPGQLNLQAWRRLTLRYPDQALISSLLGICEFGARIGFQGHWNSITIHQNLSTATEDPAIVAADIEAELGKNRLMLYSSYDSLPPNFTASPLGLADKADGSKRRIHHLLFPTHSCTSINGGIPEQYGAITYSTIDEAISAIQKLGPGSQLVKRDFESAFRHIPISPLDWTLLGLHWEDKFYTKRFLPFGLRTAPYLFNLFAEVFHWILEDSLMRQGLAEATIIHYLDDFLLVLPPVVNLSTVRTIFETRSEEVWLLIKKVKNEEGNIVSFAGLEIDTKCMVSRLPLPKLEKARKVVDNAMNQASLLLHEIQKMTGYLNFVAAVVPLGRAFLRCLYNMELYFPTTRKDYRRRISSAAHKDLAWWLKVLALSPERSIIQEVPE